MLTTAPRLIAVAGLCLALAGCTGSGPEVTAPAPKSTATKTAKPTPKPAPKPKAIPTISAGQTFSWSGMKGASVKITVTRIRYIDGYHADRAAEIHLKVKDTGTLPANPKNLDVSTFTASDGQVFSDAAFQDARSSCPAIYDAATVQAGEFVTACLWVDVPRSGRATFSHITGAFDEAGNDVLQPLFRVPLGASS